MPDEVRVFAIGDAGLTVEFSRQITREANDRAISLANHFDAEPFLGYLESVPAYVTTSVFYDVIAVRRAFPEFATAFAAVRQLVLDALTNPVGPAPVPSRLIEIPARFTPECGPDLAFVADQHGLATRAVIDLFISRTYRVYMLGFLPGFAYMGDLDDRIATGRRETPRRSVPKGSIGIAGCQTGIYSLESPGGWQIVGRTEMELFTPHGDRLTLFRAGDRVRFVEAD